MSEVIRTAPGSGPEHAGGGIWPRTALGRAAIVLGLIALASIVVFPAVTVAFRDTLPVVDTWVMPAILVLLLDASAIFSALVVWLKHERSALSILVLVLTGLAGLFATYMVVGGAIAGV